MDSKVEATVWYNNKPGWTQGVDEAGNTVWRWDGRRNVDGTPFKLNGMNFVEDAMIARIQAERNRQKPAPPAPRLGSKRHV